MDVPYSPLPILQGGVVVPLYPPTSSFLNKERVREAEKYYLSKDAPGRINATLVMVALVWAMLIVKALLY